jgi:hypothetical protein
MPEDPTSDPQDRAWYGPHDRLFIPEESEVINFVPGPEYVWCWVSRTWFFALLGGELIPVCVGMGWRG